MLCDVWFDVKGNVRNKKVRAIVVEVRGEIVMIIVMKIIIIMIVIIIIRIMMIIMIIITIITVT